MRCRGGVAGADLTLSSSSLRPQYNLNLRYNREEIYTWVGSILVAVNPYKALEIYSPETIREVRRRGSPRPPPG